MKETARQIALEGVKFGNVKGHTKIILTDVRTGKKKVVEHDNTFQSAILAKQLRSLGVANNSPWNNANWAARPLWRNLCGGIFLFRDAITAPCEYMPAGNLMVANGAYGVSNSDVPVELGSYNSVESSTSGANISFVYDWGTAQGNGTIGCICLTSELGGYIGYGNASGASAAKKSIIQDQTSEWQAIPCGFLYNGKKYGVNAIDTTNKKVTIWAYTDQVTTASIVYIQKRTSTEYSYTGDIVTGSYNDVFFRPISPTKMAIVKGSNASISNGATGRVLVFDVSTSTLSAISIVNTSGKTLYLTSTASVTMTTDSSGNIYLPTSDKTLAKFDSTGVFIDFVGKANTGAGAKIGRVAPDIIAATDNDNNILLYDGVAQRPTNGTLSGNVYLGFLDDPDLLVYGSNNTMQLYHNPLYLATINNLQTPVVKDNTQTMKVIYTLSEA